MDTIVGRVNDGELTMLLQFDMNIVFDNIRQGPNYQMQVFNLLRYLEQRNKLDPFLDHLTARRPDLLNVVSKSISTLLSPKTTEGGQNESALEAAIKGRPEPIDTGTLYGKIWKFERRICSISIPVDGGLKYGTGWLVGSDLVITNRHVISDILSGDVDRQHVKLKFDYRTNRNGDVVNPGIVVRISENEDWCLAESLHAEEDLEPGTPDPALDKLDYAIVRIKRRIGDEPVRSGAMKRGWFELPNASLPVSGADVVILQHPNGKALAESRGRVKVVLNNSSRIRYDAVTDGGSSGSPVLDFKLDIIGLHHAGDPNVPKLASYNQSIPIGLISLDANARGLNFGAEI